MTQMDSAGPASSQEPTALSVRILHSFAAAKPFHKQWNDLVASSGTDIYQTFEWCSIWWKYYGSKRSLHLLLYFSDEQLVGLVPAFIEKLWLGPTHIRIAKLIGADFSLTLCNLPVIPNVLTDVISQCIEYFLGNQRCDVLRLGPLAGPAAAIDKIQAAGQQRTSLVGRTDTLDGSCNTYFTLPHSFEDYLKSLDKKQRSNFKRMMEQSSKAHRITFDAISDADQIMPEFETFQHQHEIQWRTDGKLGHFGDWPHACDFNRDLIRSLADKGMVRFYRILADDEVISSQYCFVFGNTVYWRLPARSRSGVWDRFSLGTMGLVKMIDSLIGEGINTIEGGRGHYAYKVQYGACEWPISTVQFMRVGVGVAIRAQLFRAFAAFLNLVYYKVIFIRIAPKIPFLRRALWAFWIRRTS